MKLRHAALLAVAAALTLPTASAASLGLASQDLTPLRTCVMSGYPSGTGDEIDAMVEQSRAGNNYGTNSNVEVESHNTTNIRTYIQFLSSLCTPAIPSTATVLSATLRLYVTALPATCRTEDVFPVAASWTETGITWTNQPFGTTLNHPASGSATAQMQVGTTCTTNRAAGYVTGWNVTADVQNFVQGSANYGWMIRDDAEASGTVYTTTYRAKDYGNATECPQLVISWEGA